MLVTSKPHATESILNLDLTDHFVPMAFDFFEELPLLWNDFFKSGFEIWLVRGRVVPCRDWIYGCGSGLHIKWLVKCIKMENPAL